MHRMIEQSIVHLPELVKDIERPVSIYLVHLSRRTMKGSAVVAIGVGRGGFGCDNGACWRLAHAARLLPPKVVKSPKRSTLVSL